MNFFGFEIKKKKDESELTSVVTPSSEDGSTIISSTAAAYYSQVMDMDTHAKNENDLIKRYREISLLPECDQAIEEIVNETISVDNDGESALLNLEKLKFSDSIKNKIQDEFNEIKYLMSFDDKAADLFRRWYIDGRQYFLISLDTDNPKDGIQKVERIDSRKIKKVKKIDKEKDPKSGIEVITNVEEFYVYNDKGVGHNTTSGIQLSVDSVVHAPSGLYDENNNMTISYLHKAIKPANQLKMLEDATVIYRLARAPERRIFYIDVGNMPKHKADQYVTDIMNKFKNKIVYDASTGEIKDGTEQMSMLEDFYMPRREGSTGTSIETLPSGQNLSQIEDVQYFKQKLYQSLNVPVSRLEPDQTFSLGRSNEITRDELKFHKFCNRLKNKYSQILIDLLRVQLISKNIIKVDDWDQVERMISINFISDNNFVEMKESELYMNRFSMLQQMESYVGKFVSKKWVQSNVLKLTEDEIKDMEKEIEEEIKDGEHQDDGF